MTDPDVPSIGESSIFDRIASPESLYTAWRKVRANRGAAGIDAVSVRVFERRLGPNLRELSRNLVNGSYEPLPARYVTVVKSNGKQRELAILCVRDRVAQRAVLDVVEPLIEPELLDCSFAFRPGRSTEMAVQRIVVARAHGRLWTVDADVEEFFPAINHAVLLEELAARVPDSQVIALVKQWLDAGTLDGTRPSLSWLKKWKAPLAGASLAVRDSVNNLIDGFLSDRLETESGEMLMDDGDSPVTRSPGKKALRRVIQDGLLLVLAERAVLRGALSAKLLGLGGAAVGLALLGPPAIRKMKDLLSHNEGALIGSPLSPLLSNLYLHAFDVAMTARGYALIRYCDDFVILSSTEEEAGEALRSAENALRERKLRLNRAKTRLVPPAEPFDFLGYHFMADGRVIPPRSIPEVTAKRVADFAERHIRSVAGKTRKSVKELATRARDKTRRKQ
jgi:RNA-directed DNA polymerase